MLIRNMKELYMELLKASTGGFMGRSLQNPAIDFADAARAGEYNEMSDQEYDEILSDIKAVSKVWMQKRSRTVSELLITSIENLDLEDDDIEDISVALMCAYENTDQAHIPCDPDTGDATCDVLEDSGKESRREDAVKTEKSLQTQPAQNSSPEYILSSPMKIYEHLEKNVYGQNEAKKAAAMLLWNHVNGRRQNVLFAGPTGCGKTEIFRQLAKIYPNITIHNAATLTGSGWKGNMKVQNLFDGYKGEQREHLIIVLDEADKMFEDVDDRHYSYTVQNELLKLIEGDRVRLDGNNTPFEIDTSNVSFVFLGSFDSMVKAKEDAVNASHTIGFGVQGQEETFDGYNSIFTQEDLVTYANVRSEIAGRINNIVQLKDMTEDDYYSILCDKYISPVKRLSDYYKVRIKMSAKAKHELAKEAADTGMGVRYLRSRLQRELDKQLFVDCGKKEYIL